MEDYSKLSKKELEEVRRELIKVANRRMKNFEKLEGEEEILQKYQPYQLFLEHSRATTSGRRLTGMSMKDSRNKMLQDVMMLEKMTSQETSTVTGARKVFDRQVRKQAKKTAGHNKGKGPTYKETKEIMSDKRYYDFLHSKAFKELSAISKKASEEAIDFYVRNAEKYSNTEIEKHFNLFLESDEEVTLKEVFPKSMKESKYIQNKKNIMKYKKIKEQKMLEEEFPEEWR